MRVGARASLVTAALCFGGGMVLGGLGLHLHSLPLLYLGYGVLAGTGIGIGYTPPIAALLKWFPDRKGIASGFTIAGFGSGALVFTPVVQRLMRHYQQLPEYLGAAADVKLINQGGKFFAEIGG
jgi:MFS family permease